MTQKYTHNTLIYYLLMGLLLFVQLHDLHAQELPFFVNIRDQISIVNPAMTTVPIPVEEYQRPMPVNQLKHIFGFSGRLQWTSFGENAPQTLSASYQTKLELGRAFLWLGPYFMKDQIGPAEFTNVGAKASVHLYLQEETYISAGLVLRYFQHTLDQDLIITRQTGDPTITNNLEYNTYFSPGIGVFYNSPTLYGGISMPYVSFLDPEGQRGFSNHYHLIAGAFLDVNSRTFTFEPMLTYQKAQNFQARFDGNLKIWYYLQDDTPIWIGVGGSNVQEWRAEIGFITDSNPKANNKAPFFMLSFAYGNQVGLNVPLGNIFEAGLNIMFP